jgi:predicted nucleic acid-binding protein
MRGKNNVLIYWDACIFLSWLKGEERSDQELAGLEAMVTALDNKQLHLATSVLTYVEVLDREASGSVRERFDALFKRTNFHLVNLDRTISLIASEIRTYYLQAGSKTVSTPDSIHLATSIKRGCKTFYTFDDDNSKTLSLLSLSGTVAGKYPVQIQKPSAEQLILMTVPRSSDEEILNDE